MVNCAFVKLQYAAADVTGSDVRRAEVSEAQVPPWTIVEEWKAESTFHNTLTELSSPLSSETTSVIYNCKDGSRRPLSSEW